MTTLLSGCAMLFMDPPQTGLDPKTTEPHCTTNKGFVYWDGLITAADIATLFAFTQIDTSSLPKEKKNILVASVAVEGVVHFASALVGNGWANRCSEAIAERAAHTRSAENQTQSANPRGFYCSRNVCAREKMACERFQAGFGGSSACTLVESAFCMRVGQSVACRPTLESCQAQRAAAKVRTSECYQDW
jgi:hypothetical protein